MTQNKKINSPKENILIKQKPIPNNWIQIKLGDYGQFKGGVSSITPNDYGFGTPFISYMNVYSNSKIDIDSLDLVNVPTKDLARCDCKYGDIFFTASSETSSEVAISSVLLSKVKSLTFNGFCKRFRLNNFDTLLPKYARYLFQGKNFRKQVHRVVTGNIRFNISQESLEKIKVVLPPLDEQEKIAEILEATDESISKTQEVIDATEKLKKGLMQQLFTRGIGHTKFKQTKLGDIPENWHLTQFGDICEIYLGGTPSTRNPKYWDGNIPWLTPRDLTNHKEIYIRNGTRNITDTGLKNSSAQLMPIGTILLSSRAPIGYIAIAANAIATNQGFKNLIINPEKADNFFIYYWLKSNIRLLKILGTGSTFLEISKNSIAKIAIALPPLSEQKTIYKILKSLDNKSTLHKRRKSRLTEIKKGFMQDLLSGGRKVKVL